MRFRRYFQIFGLIAILLTVVPFIAVDYWWIRIFDFPHLQLTLLTLFAICFYLFSFNHKMMSDYIFLSMMVACFIFQGAKIYPYTSFAAFEVLENNRYQEEGTVKIFTANVLQDNDRRELLMAEIERWDPDIVVLTETNESWKQSLSPIANRTYPFRVEMPLDNTYGMILYSKLEVISPQVKFIVDDSIPSIHSLLRLRSEDTLQLYLIHPTPPMPQHNPSSTDRDAEMMKIALLSHESRYPVVAAGDFNDVAWSESTQLFQSVSGLLDVRKGRGLFNTYHADYFIFRWPLDHIFVSEHFRVITVERGRYIGSDHFPIFVELGFAPDGAEAQKAEPPTNEQLLQAKEQIKQEKEREQ